MSYRLLAHPKGHDTYLSDEEHDTVDGVVREAMSLMTGDDFLVVEVVDWKAQAEQ